MRLIACQFDIAWEDKPANFDRVRRALDRSDVTPGALVVLPEMFATGFSMNVPVVAESAARETEAFLSRVAAELEVHVLAGLVTAGSDGRGRNEAVAFGPDGAELARYSKLHPFTAAGEKEHYAPGHEVVLFRWGEITVAPFICYDLRFPEVFRAAALRGAELFAVIANWPAAREMHWTTLLRARAIENQAYVVGVNRCGRDPYQEYSGRSAIIGPRGDVVAEAAAGEGSVVGDVDRSEVVEYRRDFSPLRDVRAEYCGGPGGYELVVGHGDSDVGECRDEGVLERNSERRGTILPPAR